MQYPISLRAERHLCVGRLWRRRGVPLQRCAVPRPGSIRVRKQVTRPHCPLREIALPLLLGLTTPVPLLPSPLLLPLTAPVALVQPTPQLLLPLLPLLVQLGQRLEVGRLLLRTRLLPLACRRRCRRLCRRVGTLEAQASRGAGGRRRRVALSDHYALRACALCHPVRLRAQLEGGEAELLNHPSLAGHGWRQRPTEAAAGGGGRRSHLRHLFLSC